jgi:L,D-transpeptidase YcbB
LILSGLCRWWRIALLLLLVLGCMSGLDCATATWTRQASATAPIGAQPLSQEGEGSLRVLIEAGNLPELRWPDFSAFRGDVATFYESYGYALPWIRSMRPSPQAQAVIALLQQAEDKGLSAEDYDGPRWTERLAKLKPFTQQPAESDALRFDLAFTISLMRYISDLHTGRIDPQRFGIRVNIAERRYNLPEFLREDVVDVPDVWTALSRVEPPYPGYQQTIRALQTYRQLARENGSQPLPPVKGTITPGHSYAGVPRLARFLRLVGDLPADASVPENETVYQGALVEAVRNFQRRHGLTPDGQIDAPSLEEMNVPLDRRIRQIQLTLERWRWLPAEYQESPIVVNIPGFHLRAYDSDFQIAVTMKVVVGKAYEHNTPIFMSDLRSVIFRPYWDVPPSIAKQEIIPAIERDRGYLVKQDMEIVDGRGNVVTSDVVTAGMLDQVRAGKLSIRQRPGPKNALGLVKFMFPNDYRVYMHDTPAAVLFSRSRRDFSHGCIRLEKPVELAAWVLRGNPGWDSDRIRAAMNGDKTQQVNLAHPIPVLNVYATVIVLQDGVVNFYNDIYGQDAELDQALQKDYPYPH